MKYIFFFITLFLIACNDVQSTSTSTYNPKTCVNDCASVSTWHDISYSQKISYCTCACNKIATNDIISDDALELQINECTNVAGLVRITTPTPALTTTTSATGLAPTYTSLPPSISYTLSQPTSNPIISPPGDGYGEISPRTGLPRTNYVHGYTRRDGTVVQPYYRSHK